MVCTGEVCPHCAECANCHQTNRYDQRGNCRAKYARQCSHWRKARKVSYRAQETHAQKTVHHDVDYDEPFEEEKPIDYHAALDGKDDEESYAAIVRLPSDVKPSQAQDGFLQQSPQASQLHQQPFGTHFHHTRPPHPHFTTFYQSPGLPQHPIPHQPQQPLYQTSHVPQHQPYFNHQLLSMHPPMQTSYTWTQQPMPPAQWPYLPYPGYLFHQPYLPHGPAPGIPISRPPVPQPKHPSTFSNLFMRPLPQTIISSPQPQQRSDVPPKIQLTSSITLKRSSGTAQHPPSNKAQLRTLAPKLHIPQEQSQVLPCVAPTQLDQPVQAGRDDQIVNQMLSEQNIQASRLAARKQLEENVQAARSAVIKAQTKVNQQNQQNQQTQQTAGHRGPGSMAKLSVRTSAANEPQTTTPRQQIQPQTQFLNITPIPHNLSLDAWPSLAPQTEPPPKSLPPTQTSSVAGSQNIASRSYADRDRETLGVSISADQHEIRAAYWKREFECHPARHRESTSPFQASMAEQLFKAQEAVDRLGGFAGMSRGLWEGLDEYSNHYDLMPKDGKD